MVEADSGRNAMIGIRPTAPIERMRNQYLDRLRSTPAIGDANISQFVVVADATTNGVDVSFGLTSKTGIGSMALLRAGVNDPAQAVVLQTWTPSEATFKWSDTDKQLKTLGQAYYWVRMEPANPTGDTVTAGPQFILLSPSLVAPLEATDISASHANAANGVVLVTVNVNGVPVGESIQISVTGYLGNASPVTMAQRAKSPLQFTLEATGETVTLKALAVSSGGTPATSGPTCSLALTPGATSPAKMMGVTVAQIATGNQIMWPASYEAGITSYQVYRGQRGDAFLTATLLATVAASGTGTVIYLDLAGLGGDYQYFVKTVGTSGTSTQSDAASPAIMYNSALIPTNVPTNTSNTATIDSIDGGTSALARIYGPGGVGTSYQRLAGFGASSRPNGSISGLLYRTKYVVLYDTGTKSYSAVTTYPATLPDGYEYVGALTTTAAGAASGSGATATSVIDGGGHVIQINPTANGSGYSSATVTISGGAGAGASANANVDFFGAITSYTVTNGGSGYTSAPTITVTPGTAGGTVGGGGSTGNTGGSRISIPYPL
jgi:hypothetical protein